MRCRFNPWVGNIPWRRQKNHSSILACEIACTKEPGGVQFMGLQRVGHDLGTKQQQSILKIHKITDIKKKKNRNYSNKETK